MTIYKIETVVFIYSYLFDVSEFAYFFVIEVINIVNWVFREIAIPIVRIVTVIFIACHLGKF